MALPKPSEAAIKRTINAWLACGLAVGSVSVSQDGTIKIEAATAVNIPTPPEKKKPQAW